MQELFPTILRLSLLGSGCTLLLLLLKPLISRRFSAKWLYGAWLGVLLSLLLPVYQWIPRQEAERLTRFIPSIPSQVQMTAAPAPAKEAPSLPTDSSDPASSSRPMPPLESYLPYLWALGAGVYLLFVLTSYLRYLWKMRQTSVSVTGNPLLETVQSALGIRRKIRLRCSGNIQSPLLAGVFFPVIYLPAKPIPDWALTMILYHELTHYKRKDLPVKWIALVVNALHWFNPFAYLMCRNLSEACELACDAAVTKSMSPDEQKQYMNTILALEAN